MLIEQQIIERRERAAGAIAKILKRPATTAMRHVFEKAALAFLFPAFCSAQSLAPAEALDRYLARSRDRQPGCSDLAFDVQIEASLPKLRKQASRRGLKLISRTGHIVYRGLRFTGDNLVKKVVIGRFLGKANEAEPPEGAEGAGVTRQN